ncbi:MAG: 2Fe-2S iron-sulfur cluster-binding protein [Moorellales bacterium]
MSRPITLVIDGRLVQAPEGERLLWVALDSGIHIPHLCASREADSPHASCRLCLVEVEGEKRPVAACAYPVREGMVVRTSSPRVDRLVRRALHLLLSRHHLDCASCPARARCRLREIARRKHLRLKPEGLTALPFPTETDASAGTFVYYAGRCVLCGRCVRACREKGAGILGLIRRGLDRRVATFGEAPRAEASCRGCGACVEVCPVGALYYRADQPSARELQTAEPF